MDNSILIIIAQLAALLLLRRRKRNRRWLNRRWWVRPINRKRNEQGDFAHLFQELKNDVDMFFKYTRMDLPTFNILLKMIAPLITKKSIRFPLSPEQRLIMTLRYLATGDQIASIAFAYRTGISTARKVIKETCIAIQKVLASQYLKRPSKEEWVDIAEKYWNMWNMPNCLGAFDGKHIQVQAPSNTGSEYFNYKRTFSMVLLAACNAKYKFTLVDVGAPGSQNDAMVFNSGFGKALNKDELNIPSCKVLPGTNLELPYFFLVDSGLPLTKHTLRPYPQRNMDSKTAIFNYRLSRARRTIENAFGILASRWRIFRRPICAHPDTIQEIILAAICLHNFLIQVNENKPVFQQIYCPPTYVDRDAEDGTIIEGEWRQDQNCFSNIANDAPHRSTIEAYTLRNTLASYFEGEGAVNWQHDYINRGTYFS